MPIRQKRSLTTGLIPTTASLVIGELAMNIPDGRIFFRKSGSGSDTIQSTITTGAANSGSVTLTGSLSIFNTSGSVLDIAGDILEFSGDVMEFTGSFRVTGSFSISGSRSELFRVTDVTGSSGTIATISSGSVTVYNFTTSSLLVTGSVVANIQTNQFILGVVTASVTADQNDFSPTGWNNTDPSKATTLDITGSRSIKITGLAGGTNGRIAILRNASPDRLIILEDQSASSTAANRFDLKFSAFLLPNSIIQLMYDGISSRWEPLGSSDGISFSGFFDQYDDFIGGSPNTTTGIQAGVWTATFSGTGAVPAVSTYLVNTTERPLGAVQISTGTTATGRGNVGATEASIIPQQGQAICLSRIAPQTNLSTGAEAYHIYSGWHDSTSAPSASNAIAWQYHSGSVAGSRGFSGPNWTAVAISASTYTSSSTGPLVDTNYIWLGTYVNSTWDRATYFYSTDSVTWVIATEISGTLPRSGSTLGFGAHIGKMIGTTARLHSVDFLAHRYDITRG
jgi:hypothetical protein